MGDLGRIYLALCIVAFVVAMIGYWVLAKKGPKGAVLGAAAVLYFAGMSLSPGCLFRREAPGSCSFSRGYSNSSVSPAASSG